MRVIKRKLLSGIWVSIGLRFFKSLATKPHGMEFSYCRAWILIIFNSSQKLSAWLEIISCQFSEFVFQLKLFHSDWLISRYHMNYFQSLEFWIIFFWHPFISSDLLRRSTTLKVHEKRQTDWINENTFIAARI